MNAISEAHGQEDRLAAESYVSSGFFMLSAIALLVSSDLAQLTPLSPGRGFLIHLQAGGPGGRSGYGSVCRLFRVNLPLGVVRYSPARLSGGLHQQPVGKCRQSLHGASPGDIYESRFDMAGSWPWPEPLPVALLLNSIELCLVLAARGCVPKLQNYREDQRQEGDPHRAIFFHPTDGRNLYLCLG